MRRPVANIPLPAMSAVCDACKLRVHIGVSPTASLPASVSSAPVGVAVVPQARKFVAAATTMQLRITTPRSCPMTTDFGVWYAPSTIFALVVTVALVAYAFYIALAGQRVFKGKLLPD